MRISKKVFSLLASVLVVLSFAAFSSAEEADLVFYGKIFTSESNQIVEAFAVQSFGTIIDFRDSGAKAVYGMGWEFQTFKDNMPRCNMRRYSYVLCR